MKEASNTLDLQTTTGFFRMKYSLELLPLSAFTAPNFKGLFFTRIGTPD
jgi:hypothetical protein